MKIFKYALVLYIFLPLQANAAMHQIKADGLYTHKASGMTFPLSIHNFQRVNVLQYDEKGLDVSAGYDLVSSMGDISATIYIFPAPRLTSFGSPANVIAGARAKLSQDLFDRVKQEIFQHHTGVNLLQEKEISLPQGDTAYSGEMATFEYEEIFAHRFQVVRSEVYLFCYVGKKWSIEYRFTYPKNYNGSQEIEGFIQNFHWTL